MNKYLLTIIMLTTLLFSGCIPYCKISDPINVTQLAFEGHQYNAWNNTLVSANARSNIIDTKNLPHISIISETSGLTTLSVYVSEDCEHFVLCEDLTEKINAPTGFSTHIFFTAGARCYQLESSDAVRINATIVAKP